MEGLTANSVSSDLKPSAAQIPSLTKKSPQDWRAYIDHMKLKVQDWDDHRRYRTISYLYVNAFKLVPDADFSSLSHAQLLVDFAEFTSYYDLNEAVRILVSGRKTLSRYSIIHVASAELELKRGQREEAVNILQKAISLKTEPVSDIMRALERLNEGKTELRDHAERTQDDTDCGVLMDISNKPELSTVRNVKADALTSMSAAASQNASFPADVPNTRERADVFTTPACKLPKVVDKMIIGDSCQRSDSFQRSDSSQKSDSCQRSEIPSVLIVEPPLHQGPTRKLQLPSLDKTRLTTEISGPITQQSNGTWPVYSSTPLSLRSGDRTGDRLEVRAESTRECLMKQHEVQQQGGVSRRSLSTNDYGFAVNSAITPAKSLLMSNSFTGDSVTPGVSLELDSKRVIQNGGRDSTGEISSSQLSGSLTFRKFRPLNLGPPRRVKVNPTLKKLSDDEDEEIQSQRSTFSDQEPHSQPAAGPLGQAEAQLANSSTNTAVQVDTHTGILQDKSHQRQGASLFTGAKPEILPTPKKTDSGVVWERTCQRSAVKSFPAAKSDALTQLFTAGSASRAAADACGFPLVAHNKCHSNSTSSHPSGEAPRVADKTIIGDSLRNDISAVLMVKPVSCQGPSRKLQLPSSDYSNRLTAEVSRPIAQFSNGAYPSTPVGIRPDEHQKVESTKEILIKQQELIQQLLQQQQQQQHQHSTANINPSGEAPRVADKTIIGDSLRNDISAVLMVKPVSCQGPSRKLQLPSSDYSNRPTAEVSRPIAQFSNGAYPAYPSTPVGIRPDEHQKVESTKEILIKKQQELIQQLLQQQQQQQQQSMANNRTFPVGDSQLAVPSGITPAKSHIQSEHKTIVVNGKPYTVMNIVGRGGSAKVYRVYDPATNTILAVKCVNLACANHVIVEGYKNEINLLKKLQHCGRVIKLYDYEYVEASKKLYVVLEYGETDLCKFISQNEKSQTLHPINISYFWFQMVSAVHAMHKEGVIHSDLKPANFILVSGEVKLIDFGIANSLQQDSTSVLKENMVGTPSYMSPEALMSVGPYTDDSKPTYKIGVRSDVWSLGCILYQMVYGHTPFQHVRQKLEAIVNPAHQIPFPDKGDPKLMDILKKCLTRNISERPTTSELLNHPYLQK